MEAREIRRKDRQIGPEESREILNKGIYGVLATVDGDGQPYAVPLSYVIRNDQIYFHCARTGHKIDNLTANPRVSFVVVGQAEAVYNGHYTTYYESALVFGRAREITDESEKYATVYDLAEKYVPNDLGPADEYIKKLMKPMAIYAITMDSVTGKANKKK